MGTTELQSQDFDIEVNLNGKPSTLQVKVEETTDGVAYYECIHSGKSLTQIRKEEDGNWEQIWGDLDQPTVNLIGSAISNK
jgi:hypothetical protein